MSKSATLTINIDGAARGNPGPAACAYVIARDGAPLLEEAERLGSTTNNVAEYTALVRALERAGELGGRRLVIRSDSELLVKQMNGQYRVKNEQLRELYEEAKGLCAGFEAVSIFHVPRAANSAADRLCNEVLDGRRPAAPAGARKPSAANRNRTPKKVRQERAPEKVRQEAVRCLRAAAAAWVLDAAQAPSPEEVWDQLWTLLADNGVLRSSGSREEE